MYHIIWITMQLHRWEAQIRVQDVTSAGNVELTGHNVADE